MTGYIYDAGWERERRRLEALCGLFDEGTTQLLTRLDPKPGWRCLEVAAGIGSIARWLATRVGRDRNVVATDLDTRFLEAAAQDGVAVLRHDIVNDPLEPESFDLVHTRLLLMHLPERERALDNMLRALRPGGTLLVEDFIITPGAAPSYPESPQGSKLSDAFSAVFRAFGADPTYGIKLPDAFRRRGFDTVYFEVRTPVVYSGTPSVDFTVLSLEQLRPHFVSSGLLQDAEIDALLALSRTPGAVSLMAPMAACWVTKPS